MRQGIWVAMLCMGALAGWSTAHAAEEEEPVPGDVETACKAVAEAISFVGGYLAGMSFGDIGKALGAHIATKYGPDAVNKRCKNYYRSLEEEKNSFDYNEFVRDVCGGNPLTCPNGWNALSWLPGRPQDCRMYIVCNLSLAVRSDNSLSVQDMLNSGAFIDLSHRVGYWDYSSFGYLVGIESTSSSLEIY